MLDSTQVSLSIVIVNWNTRDLLFRCLVSVFANPPHTSFEVIVVDNASHDQSVEMVRQHFPQVRLIASDINAGFARSNNRGIAVSQGRYILLLNPDTEVPVSALSRMVQFMETHQQVGVIGPKLVNPDGSFQASYAKFPTLFSEFSLMIGLARRVLGPYAPSPRPTPGEQPRSVDWVAGAALMARRASLEQVGLLDEDYFLYSEETDWCWRFWQNGWQVWYLPDVSVMHIGGASSRQRSVNSYVRLYAAKVLFFSKSYGAIQARCLRFMFFSVSAARLLTWYIIDRLADQLGRKRKNAERIEQERALLRYSRSRQA